MRAMRLHAALFAVLLAAPALVAQQGAVIRIHAATVLDGTGRTLRNATVVVQGSKITRSKPGRRPTPHTISDKLTVLPGMIDVHAHIGWHFDKRRALRRSARARRRKKFFTPPRTRT